ncbi:MAG: hypothetical protein ACRC51_08930 [Cetobacterium sp.]
MNNELLLPILGSFLLGFILILGFFSIKMILFPNKTYKEQEIELQEEIEEALHNFIPIIISEEESPKKILEKVDNNIKKLKEIEVNKINSLKEELIYQKLKIDEELKIKIKILKEKEQKQYFINCLEALKKHSEDLSNNEITELINYIEKISK